MRGNMSLNSPSYLPSLYSGRTAGNSLLAALTAAGGGAVASAEAARSVLEQALMEEPEQVARMIADPAVQRDVASYIMALDKAKTPSQLLSEDATIRVLLTAHGMADQAANTGMAMRALLSDIGKASAFVHQLHDARWLAVTRFCAFASRGLAALREPSSIDSISRGLARAVWRASLDAITPGIALAMDFVDRGATIRSAWQVLGDPVFLAVITTVLGFPRRMAFQPVAAREAAIASGVDLTRFQDPGFVRQFAERYLAAMGGARAEAGPSERLAG